MIPQWIGRFQVGQELMLLLRCRLDGVGDVPDTHPVVEVRSESGFVEERRVPADDQDAVPGLFRGPLFLGSLYATGRYHLYFRWADSDGEMRVEIHDFEIAPGGQADGAVISMTSVERPQANFLLFNTDAGRLVRGRNPE